MIELKDIVVKFGDFEALHNINVNVKEGEFFTFLGPSGCGKTTTLRTITGFIEPVSGTVSVNEQDITHVPIEKRNIGIVFQSYALFPTMTVYDNIAFGLKLKKLKKPEIDQKVREIARKVDLSDEQLKKAVSQLSGGQQQRVAIARALVTGPSIICMDEPLSNLDAKLRTQMRVELAALQHAVGTTTIYVTHDQTEAMTTIDVNTGGYVGKRDFSDTVFKTNLEAAQTIARQLRLRNLGGIIIVDFIDMSCDEHREAVLAELRRSVSTDRTRMTVSNFTELGLVEMTRKRTRESLAHVLCEPCPMCGGRGEVRTARTSATRSCVRS